MLPGTVVVPHFGHFLGSGFWHWVHVEASSGLSAPHSGQQNIGLPHLLQNLLPLADSPPHLPHLTVGFTTAGFSGTAVKGAAHAAQNRDPAGLTCRHCVQVRPPVCIC